MIIVPESTHHLLGGSSATRWINCPYSVRASQKALNENKIPVREVGLAAKKGTAVHYISEMCLRDLVMPEVYSNETAVVEGTEIELTGYLIEMAEIYISYIVSRNFEKGIPEFKGELTNEAGGSADYVGISANCVEVTDLKTGQNIVEVEDNDQLKFYALLVLKKVPKYIETFRLTIVQPLQPHVDGEIRSWEISRRELTRWKRRSVMPAIRSIDDPNLEPNPGEWCTWCPLENICRARHNKFLEIDFGDINHLAIEDIEVILKKKKEIVDYLDTMEKQLKFMLAQGESSSYFHLKESFSNRKFVSQAEKKLLGAFEGEIYDKSIKSPAKLEELYRQENGCTKKEAREFIDQYTYRESIGTKLAPIKDPGNINSVYSDFTEQET